MKKFFSVLGKSLGWLVVGIIGLVLLVFLLIYIPPVQDAIIGKVLDGINSKGEMQLGAKRLRLIFPLRLEVDSLHLQTSGLMVEAAEVRTSVDVAPLFVGKASLPALKLLGAKVVIGSPDSLLYMRAGLDSVGFRSTSVGLATHAIHIGDFDALGGDVDMKIRPDTVPPKPSEPSAPTDWSVALKNARLRNIRYGMQLLPTIDTLDCRLGEAEIADVEVSLAKSTVKVGKLALDGVDARFIQQTPEYIAAHPVPVFEEPDTVAATMPWTVTGRTVKLTNGHAVYALAGAVPGTNFNPQYIEASEIKIQVDSFMNRGVAVHVPLKELSARERCGIALSATGLFDMDSTAMHAENFRITTPGSSISLDAMMGLNTADPAIAANVQASVGHYDLCRLVPETMASVVEMLPPYEPVNLGVDVKGRMNSPVIEDVSVEIPRHLKLWAKGYVSDYDNLDKMDGNIALEGKLVDGSFVKPLLRDVKTGKVPAVEIPTLALDGSIRFRSGVIKGDLQAVVSRTGHVALDAMWNNRVQGYDIDLRCDDFPIQTILPTSGASDITAQAQVKGQGLDVFSPRTHVDAHVVLNNATYLGRTYSDVTLDAMLSDGHASVEALSRNAKANFMLHGNGNLSGRELAWDFGGDVKYIDLKALGLTDSVLDGSVTLSGNMRMTPAVAATRRKPGVPMVLTADVDVQRLYLHLPGESVNTDGLRLSFHTDSVLTGATIANGDLLAEFNADVALDTLLGKITAASGILNYSLHDRHLLIDSLQRALPPFTLHLTSGADNVLTNYLSGHDMAFNDLQLTATNDSVFNAHGRVLRFRSGETFFDTITVALEQKGQYLLYDVAMNNAPGTFDAFAHVSARGYVNRERLSLIARQENIQGETGYSLGAIAAMKDSTTVQLRFVPYHPVIGYKDWEINRDNVITYDFQNKHMDANLHLFNDVSSVKLYTQHTEGSTMQEDIVFNVSDIEIADWIAFNPFAPQMKGNLSADMRLSWNRPDLNGVGTVALDNFYYDRKRVGDFALDVNVTTNAKGTVRAETALKVNGVQAVTAKGNLNDSTAVNPFMLDFRMIQFPLEVVNPFLGSGTAKLQGTLNGEMDVTGSLTEPEFNGYIYFDSTTVNVDMLGTPFRFADTRIPMENNVVKFDNFSIYGVNNNPLTINGTVALTPLIEPKLNLSMNASNLQVVGSKKSRYSQVYGKAFVNLDAQVKGTLRMLMVDADATLLSGSNVTYVMEEAVSSLTSRSNQDMVKFVNFNDTAAVETADTLATPASIMSIDAKLTIAQGTTVNVDISSDGKNKASIEPSGNLTYSQDFMGDQRTTGRININKGFVRYTPPMLSEKYFTFSEGSYVAFNGDMLNPVLNIHAVDEMKANVTQSGNNARVINFDVLLGITGTLEQMNVEFDLECPDDLTVANELKSMSPDQRANQAMNLLLYGMYTGAVTSTTGGNIGANALFGFLEGQLNTWAAQAVKGVDISFGIHQYDTTVDGNNTSAMSYSYRVSKSLFDDRFKIVVGGNYTTDANADENFAQNLIADISFEYMLNKAGTMYVRLFRHTGYESVLEGEITQTGVGFVYKRKIRRLGDIFRFLRPKKRKSSATATEVAAPSPSPKEQTTESIDPQPAAKNDEK